MLKETLFFTKPYHLSSQNEQLNISDKSSGKKPLASRPYEDLGYLILEHPQISFSQSVMQKCAENNVAVVFCNAKRLPVSLLLHLDTNTVQQEVFKYQIGASLPLKKRLWQQTIHAKITNQAYLLKKLGKREAPLLDLIKDIRVGDQTNREAVASKYYWSELFSNDFPGFIRERYGYPPNNYLNYAYAILRAAVARALIGSGLLPLVGINHHNRYNHYCLADDIMEPYRPFVDELVYQMVWQNHCESDLSQHTKLKLLEILTKDVFFPRTVRPLSIALSMTTASLAICLKGDSEKLKYPSLK